MSNCERFQSQLLDSLYDLLDHSESAALRDHLSGCEACQGAMVHARRQVQLISAAARLQFPEVQFGDVRQPWHERATLPLRPRTHSQAITWIRWAVAAGVLLIVGGLGLGTTTYWRQHDRVALAQSNMDGLLRDARAMVDSQQAEKRTAETEIVTAQTALAALTPKVTEEIAKVVENLRSQPIRMSISGPPTVEAGGVNQFQVLVCDTANRPVAANIEAAVCDSRTSQEICRLAPAPSATPGTVNLTLPRDLPVKPDSDLQLVVNAKTTTGEKGGLTEKLKLVAPVYLTHLATDKPMYQPGETVHFRSLTLERFSLRPVSEELRLSYGITNPMGVMQPILQGAARTADEVTRLSFLGPDREPVRGVGAGEFVIGEDAPGGEYTLTVSELDGRFPPQTRKFIVNRYQKPRLNKEMEFTKKSYGPGDEVVAGCKVALAEGGKPVADQPVVATLKVDDQAPQTAQLRTDANGGVNVRFQLPAKIERGNAMLAVQFTDQGNVESIAHPVPVVLKKLRVEFFPEGGDLVADVPNRVYFWARTTLDKPAEIKGHVVDGNGNVIVAAETFNEPTKPGANQGMGCFEFTPELGKKYSLRIDTPSGIEGQTVLPAPVADGIVLTVPTGVTTGKEAIRAIVHGGKESKRLLVGAYCRGRLMAHERMATAPGQATEVLLRPDSGIGGVFRITIFEEQGMGDSIHLIPRAERLVYRTPERQLNLTVQANKPVYTPGEKVNLSYCSLDEKGNPAPAIAMVSVVDKSVIKLADEKTFRMMPTHFLLTNEVRRPEDLEHADFLLTNDPKAAVAVDLLLGTQGWRRFVEQHDPEEFKRKNQVDSTELAVRSGRLTPEVTRKITRSGEFAASDLCDKFSQESVLLHDQLIRAERRLEHATLRDEEIRSELVSMQSRFDDANRELAVQQWRLDEYRTTTRRVVVPVVAVGLLGIAVLCLGYAVVVRRQNSFVPCLVVSGVSVVLVGVVMFAGWRLSTPSVIHGSELAGGAFVSAPTLDMTTPVSSAPFAETATRGKGDGGVPADRTKTGERGRVPGMPPLPAAPAGMAQQMRGMRLDPQNEPGKGGQDAKKDLRDAPAADGKRLGMLGRGGAELEKARVAKEHGAAGFQEERQRFARREGGERARKQMMEVGQQQDALKVIAPAGRIPAGGKLEGDRAFNKRRSNGRGEALLASLLERTTRPPEPPCYVREYAHVRQTSQDNVRTDATETIYWHPVLVFADGKGASQFNLPDSVTTFQVLVAGHTLDGRLGSVTFDLPVRQPLTLEPKLPIEVTSNDKIDVPLTIANGTDGNQSVTLQVQTKNVTSVAGASTSPIALAPNGRDRRVLRVQPNVGEGEAQLQFEGQSGTFSDRVVRSFKIVPDGFPIVGTQSDMLERVAAHDLVLPESWIPDTLKYQATVYPSTLADLQKGLEGLLREPNGCFEQTSTTNYPNLLVLDYLKESDQAKPEVARRAQDLLSRGYQKLTAFECLDTAKNQRQGYEWFGGTAPAHEALTAYGLMQFRDMARVYDVDQAMLKRTQQYLLSRRDGKGGFLRNAKALDTFGRAPDQITSAYIVWALTESGGQDDLTTELAALNEQAQTSKDAYFLALVANSLVNRARGEEAASILTKLVELQKSDGHLDAATTSITGSGGRDLQIETTALTVMAWLKAKRPDQFNLAIQKAVKWIGQQRGGNGGFGSTQSTILTLKALIAYAKANKKTAEAGEVVLYQGAREIARQAFAAGAEDAIVLDVKDAEKILMPGRNDLRIELTSKSIFPYTASWSYRSVKPLSAEQCSVDLKTTLERPATTEGETVGLKINVENKIDRGQGMVVAIVGLPAGLTLPEDMKKLKDLARLRNDGTERGDIDAWELRGRELVLYWRDMAPRKKVEINLELICRVPGEYRGPASRAYLYYNADHKCWVKPLAVAIKAKGE